MLSSKNSDTPNSRKNFLISMNIKQRPLKYRPIMGIDYDKLIYGNRKPRYISLQSSTNNGSDFLSTEVPKNSIIRNQTSHSLNRPIINQSNSSKNFAKPLQRQENNSSQQFDKPDKLDFETFKKYQKEFQEFRRSSQQQNLQQQLMQQNSYPKQQQNINSESSKNQMKKLLGNNVGFPFNQRYMNRSQLIDKNSKLINFKKNISVTQATEPDEQEQINEIHQRSSSKDILQNKVEQQQEEEQKQNEKEQSNQSQSTKNNNEINIQNQNQNEQIQQADRNYELQKEQQMQEQQIDKQKCITEPSQSEFSSQLFDAYSTSQARMVDKYMSQNPDYFKHLQGDCICGRCTCGKCKCPYKSMPVDFKRGMQTMYQQDFQKHKSFDGDIPQMTMDFHSQIYNLDQLKCYTTTQSDFKPHDVKEPIYYKAPISNKLDCPFVGSSSYKNNYVDWKYTQPERMSNPIEQTVVQNVPFIGKTMYTENFYKKPTRDREFEDFIKMKQKSKLSPISPDFRYLNETNYQFFYQGKNPDQARSFKPNQYYQQITPTVPDQYRTTFVREYEDKSSIICPSSLELIALKKKKQQEKYKEYLERERLKNSQEPVTMNTIFQLNNNRPLKTHA